MESLSSISAFIRPGEQIFRELFSSYWLKILLSTTVMCLLLFRSLLVLKTGKREKWFTKKEISFAGELLRSPREEIFYIDIQQHILLA